MAQSAAAEMATGARQNGDSVSAVSLTSGATQTMDVPTFGKGNLVVQAELTAAVATDLTVTVTPYEADNVTLSGLTIDIPLQSQGPSFAGGKATYWGTYDVDAFDRVRVTFKNNNAGTQTLNLASWNLND